ncbi:uncharacterized protein LOC121693513 isoform X2 [Alosa sapidissima]|nr:uncharacterized protein LOC121693513 isoform X2 [Alosa sapidissima]
MTAGYPDIYTRNEIVGNTCIETYTPKNSMEPDPILCLFFSECTETSGTDWIGILQRFHTLKRLTQSSPEFPVEMEALLSSLRSTPHLAALRLKVTCLDMSWAVWTLSLPHTCPGLKDIVVAEAVCDDERSVCTYISTEESNHNTSTRYMDFSDDLWLQQHPEKYPFYDEFSNVFFEIVIPPPNAVISSISFTLRSSPEIFSFNWKDFLMNLHLMKNKDSPTFDEHQGALLTSLHSLPIKQLSIERLCLTDTWTQGIVSLIQTCLSIEKLHLTASCSGHSLMNAVQLLQKSNIRSDCTLVVVGCRKCTDQCTENKHLSCNQKMKITINGKYVKMERIYPDDDYYPDDEPDIPDPIFYLGVDNWETEDEQDGDEDAG